AGGAKICQAAPRIDCHDLRARRDERLEPMARRGAVPRDGVHARRHSPGPFERLSREAREAAVRQERQDPDPHRPRIALTPPGRRIDSLRYEAPERPDRFERTSPDFRFWTGPPEGRSGKRTAPCRRNMRVYVAGAPEE